jgi:hypothetical protein
LFERWGMGMRSYDNTSEQWQEKTITIIWVNASQTTWNCNVHSMANSFSTAFQKTKMTKITQDEIKFRN